MLAPEAPRWSYRRWPFFGSMETQWNGHPSGTRTNLQFIWMPVSLRLISLITVPTRQLCSHAIAGHTLPSANYQQAIEVLCKRFSNKQVISKHMDMLMNMDTISSDGHLKDLRRLYDHTESNVRSFRSLGIEAASYGALLSSFAFQVASQTPAHCEQEGVWLQTQLYAHRFQPRLYAHRRGFIRGRGMS